MSDFQSFLWDGRGMTYNTGWPVMIIKCVAMATGLLLLVTVVLHVVLLYQRRKMKQVELKQVDETHPTDREADIVSITLPCMEIVADVFMWIGALLGVLIYSVLSGFDFISTSLAIVLMLITLFIFLAYQIIRFSIYVHGCKFYPKLLVTYQEYFTNRTMAVIHRLKWYLLAFTGFLIFYSVFFPFLFRKSCLCYQTTAYGDTFGDLHYSTQMTRGIWLPEKVCEDEEICHVYATLPYNTSNFVFVNVHAGRGIEQITLISTLKQDSLKIETQYKCNTIPFPHEIEERGKRHVYTCLVSDLLPDTKYSFSLVDEDDQVLYVQDYRTLPEKGQDLDRNITIIFGGDFGYDTKGLKLLDQFQRFDPDLIMIGGDLSYDNGHIHCYYSWDMMLWSFQDAFESIGRLVPMILAVGNHDVGFHSMSATNITVSDDSGPLYFTYFPQAFKNEELGKGIRAISDRRTFNFHLVYNYIILSLDSGYLYGYSDPQTTWMKQTLGQWNTYIPIAQYHNPLYPTCFQNGTTKYPDSQLWLGHDVWEPIFDEYKVKVAFENHVHQFKRTKPIKRGKLDPDGTVYFGDGAMGVKEKICKEQYRTNETLFPGYFEAYQIESASHFWVMKILQGITIEIFTLDRSLEFIAYGPNQEIIQNSYATIKPKTDIIHVDL